MAAETAHAAGTVGADELEGGSVKGRSLWSDAMHRFMRNRAVTPCVPSRRASRDDRGAARDRVHGVAARARRVLRARVCDEAGSQETRLAKSSHTITMFRDRQIGPASTYSPASRPFNDA